MINKKILKDYNRFNVVDFLKRKDLIGIELGVAKGEFSKRMIESGKFKFFYGVDLYSDHHDSKEYINTLKYLGLEKNYKLLRVSFEDALNLFEDNYFDFVYVDGYAHGGQEGGKTLCDWIKKVKIGGIISGDDYDKKFPLTMSAVNYLAQNTTKEIFITNKELFPQDGYKHFASWIIEVNKKYKISPEKNLIFQSKIKNFIHKIRIRLKYFFKFK